MSNFSQIRDEIKTILSSVTGIGVVHTRERYVKERAEFKKLFISGDKINGWTITRSQTTETRMPGEATRSYQFTIRGYFSFHDDDTAASSSEQIFQELVEAICDTFRTNPTLNGKAVTSGPMQVVGLEPRMFAEVLVHYVELSLEVLEQIAVTV
jgi:hypothetical protein